MPPRLSYAQVAQHHHKEKERIAREKQNSESEKDKDKKKETNYARELRGEDMVSGKGKGK